MMETSLTTRQLVAILAVPIVICAIAALIERIT